MTTQAADVESALCPTFPKKHVGPAVAHFRDAVRCFQGAEWERSIAKAGKFIEAALKALGTRAGVAVPSGKAFKVDGIINSLGSQPVAGRDDSICILIPRACRFVYDIASNRGARHDADEVEANEMDATVTTQVSAWILGEMVRVAQRGAMDLEDARQLVTSLTQRAYPMIEEVEGRVYVHLKKKTAKEVALVVLARRYPGRLGRQELVNAITRNGFSAGNARMALSRVSRLVDDNGKGLLRLLGPGLQQAEALIRDGRPA